MSDLLIKSIFEKGKAIGFDHQEVYVQNSKKLAISVFKQEIDKYSLSENSGLSYRGMINGKMGYSYTELMDASSVDMLVNEAFKNAQIIESEDKVFIHSAGDVYQEVDVFNPSLSENPISDKIKFMLNLEKAFEGCDSRIKQVVSNAYEESEVERRIVNTHGLDVFEKSNYCLAYVNVSAQEQGDTRTGLSYQVTNHFEQLSIPYLVDKALKEAVSMLGAKAIPSKQYPIVFKNTAFAELQSAFNSIYSAESVQNDLSKLKEKLDHKIAVDLFTLIDDPHLAKGIATSSFDAEGVATKCKALVENGILKTYLHNLKTAKKEGVKSTGNASKGSYKGTIDIAPSNIYIQRGNFNFEALLMGITEGVYITNLQGLHAGLNVVSGDFSLQCHGYTIKNGQIDRPVSQITVAGNYFEMIKSIEMIGNDLEFSIMGSDYTGSPSIKIKTLTVSGE